MPDIVVDFGRRVDQIGLMKKPTDAHKKARQIVGFSLTPETARAVKTEAAQRGLSLKALFAELWQLYEQTHAKGKS